eukprot:7407682-Ditylum_brightwellii.AAC.1
MGCLCEPVHGTLSSMCNLFLPSDRKGIPGGLTDFGFPQSQASATTTHSRSLAAHICATKGQGYSNKDIQVLTAAKLFLPLSFDEVKQMIKALASCILLLTGSATTPD